MDQKIKKLFFVLVAICCIMPNITHANTQVFLSKDGMYSVSYPSHWYTFEFNDHLAGIQHYFVPQKISPKKFKKEGADLDISFSLHVRQIKKSARSETNKEILTQIIKHDKSYYLKYGIQTVSGNISDLTLNKKLWTITTLHQPSDQETTTYYLHRRGSFLYKINVHVKDKLQKEFKPVIDQFIQSFKINPANEIPSKQFISHNGDFAISLPAEWFYKEYNHKNTDQYLITRKNLINKDSFFYVGATITRFKNAKHLFSLKDYSDNKLKAAYLYRISQHTTKNENETILHSLQKRKTKQGLNIDVMERDVYVTNSNYTYREYHVIFLHKGDLFVCVFEAPTTLFEMYRPTFENAYTSIFISK